MSTGWLLPALSTIAFIVLAVVIPFVVCSGDVRKNHPDPGYDGRNAR